ncbi:DUF1282 family protein [Moritella sp. 5]|uniref:Yip1 family protein n=1 Tax=Moritella sp. 5 TaxID=2746231 RepID=UPI001BA46DEB|nr:Yip1 family protein [Moritella sp. 5]QUM78864.1 DUF1282 family protein [Moritella sp. 5]
MLVKHLWGLYVQPKDEWIDIDTHHESLLSVVVSLFFFALIPAISAWYTATVTGWKLGFGDTTYLSSSSAGIMAVGMVIVSIAIVATFSLFVQWMAGNFGSSSSFTQALELTTYTAAPIFITGIAALIPVAWVIMLALLVGVAFSVRALYTGVPIIMHITEERGFIYASSLLTVGLVLFVASMGITVVMWSFGFGPQFII